MKNKSVFKMNLGADLKGKRDKLAAFASALLLHVLVLSCLSTYQIMPPPSEALTLFVSIVNPDAPAETVQTRPATTEPAQTVRKPKAVSETVSPIVSHPISHSAPLTAPREPVEPQPPAGWVQPSAGAVMLPGNDRPAHVPSVSSAAPAPQTAARHDELSVSCSERTPPAYPKQSLRLGEQGKTVVQVELDELGRVAHVAIKTKSGFTRLDEAAVNAVKTWRCTPAKRNGVAVRSVAEQPFNFTIKGR